MHGRVTPEANAMTLSSVLSPERARALVRRFHSMSVLVAGDLMLDQFVIGRLDPDLARGARASSSHDHDEYRIGGAGNVAHNVRALGGRVDSVGLIGRDRPRAACAAG